MENTWKGSREIAPKNERSGQGLPEKGATGDTEPGNQKATHPVQ